MGRSTTGPPCSVTVELELDWRQHDVIAWHARVKPPAGPPWSVTDDDDRRQRALLVWPATCDLPKFNHLVLCGQG